MTNFLYSQRNRLAHSIFFTLFFSNLALAQQAEGNGITNNLNGIVLFVLIITVLLIVLMLYIIAEKLIAITSEKIGVTDQQKNYLSIIPQLNELTGKPLTDDSRKIFKLKKGFNIRIRGKASTDNVLTVPVSTYAINPKDFLGLAPIPKLVVAERQEVKAGDPLFYDKSRPDVFITAPVSGEIIEIRRGAKRSLEEIVILADSEISFKNFSIAQPKDISKEKIIAQLKESGAWAYLRQRPYQLIADSETTPKSIFISGFDTSPLAPDYNFTLAGKNLAFQAGLDALSKLVYGKIYLSLPANRPICEAFQAAKGVQKYYFEGKHPSGLVGIQIHHIAPINKGDIVWTIDPHHVALIGQLFLTGKYDTSQLVAVAGSELMKPSYYKTYQGANVESFLKNNLLQENVRIISGNVLTGKAISSKGFLGFFDRLVTVIEEGNQYELFGWLLPQYPRPSLSPTIPWSTINAKEEFKVNTNLNGEHRALVVTGEYEKVLPMDIYPHHLIKAILSNDFEKMENLGIYELVEEDLALCEFVCTSKTEVQQILRQGLDYVREQN